MKSYNMLLLRPDEIERAPDVMDTWNALVQASANIGVLYQSPVWWECNRDLEGDNRMLAVMKSGDGTIEAICPLLRNEYSFSFGLLGRGLRPVRVPIAEILGGEPLLRGHHCVDPQFFRLLLEGCPAVAGIYLKSIRSDSSYWNLLHASRALRAGTLVYLPDGDRPYHSITLAPTFSEYLAKFRSKTRSGLQRNVKLLRSKGNGNLELVRIETEKDVDLLIEAENQISARSWQGRIFGIQIPDKPAYRAFLMCCARSGILRSYLLRCGGEYCSFVQGYQFQGIYYYKKTAFDESYGKLSPGTALTHLLLEDLTNERPARKVNYAHGDWAYKRLFGTDHLSDTSALFLRKRLKYRLLIMSHGAYSGLLRKVKRIMGRNRDYVRGE